MVHYCWVLGCKNRSNKTDVRKVSYFGIPLQNPDRIQQWLYKIGRSNFSSKPHQFFENKRICSEHFETTMLGVSNSKLKSNATPTIFNHQCGYKEQVNKENKSPNIDLPNQLIMDHNAPSCSTFVSASEKQIQVNAENKSPNVPTELTKTSKALSFTTTKNRLLAKIKMLRRRNLKLEQTLKLKSKVTQGQFVTFCKENLGENLATFFEMQLKLANSKGKGSRYPKKFKEFALSIYSLGGKEMYNFLQKELQLPSKATLYRIANKQ